MSTDGEQEATPPSSDDEVLAAADPELVTRVQQKYKKASKRARPKRSLWKSFRAFWGREVTDSEVSTIKNSDSAGELSQSGELSGQEDEHAESWYSELGPLNEQDLLTSTASEHSSQITENSYRGVALNYVPTELPEHWPYDQDFPLGTSSEPDCGYDRKQFYDPKLNFTVPVADRDLYTLPVTYDFHQDQVPTKEIPDVRDEPDSPTFPKSRGSQADTVPTDGVQAEVAKSDNMDHRDKRQDRSDVSAQYIKDEFLNKWVDAQATVVRKCSLHSATSRHNDLAIFHVPSVFYIYSNY